MAVKPVVLSRIDGGAECQICGDGAAMKIKKLGCICEECLMEIARQWNRVQPASVH